MKRTVKTTIDVPVKLHAWVEQQVRSGRYKTSSAFFREAAYKAREVSSLEQLETLIDEGLKSGPMSRLTTKDFADMRAEVKRRAKERSTIISQARRSA